MNAFCDELGQLGVEPNGVLLVHSSYRKIRPVEGGPQGVIEALLRAVGPNGTLVMPTMTDGETIYNPRETPTYEMGIIAETFWRQPGVIRSNHPGASFAAYGPLAKTICAEHLLEPPHGIDSPVGRVYEADGQVLLLGVFHSENTTIHLAESLAKVPYWVSHPCVVVEGSTVKTRLIAESDRCCQGFNQVDLWLNRENKQRVQRVGQADCRLIRSADIVRVCLEQLKKNPLVFLCEEGSGCDECDLAHASVHMVREQQ